MADFILEEMTLSVSCQLLEKQVKIEIMTLLPPLRYMNCRRYSPGWL